MNTNGDAIIIGVGNPLLSDDAVGIATVRKLREYLDAQEGVVLRELYTGGIRLMEAMAGFQRAWIVDAMVSGTAPPGTISRFSPGDFVATRHATSSHDTDLATALETARLRRLPIPREICIWGIEAAEVELFGEILTPAVARAIPQVIDAILRDLVGTGGQPCA
jgi:hydrogenase maturation protease